MLLHTGVRDVNQISRVAELGIREDRGACNTPVRSKQIEHCVKVSTQGLAD
jgi:hypothetical protein